jgi:DUF1365 family protein
MNSALYPGDILHHRLWPRRHRFIYRLTSWLIDIDELSLLDRQFPLFSWNRPAPLAFMDRDYGFGDGRPPRAFIDSMLLQYQLEPAYRVELLCQIRFLGYVFNPLVVWFCYNRQGQLMATLYEVHNTFRQRHHYLVVTDQLSTNPHHQHRVDKCFYVSPFTPVAGHYCFRFKYPQHSLHLTIRHKIGNQPMLNAVWRGQRRPLTHRSMAMQLLLRPLATIKIVCAIHWEAWRLWLKGLRLKSRPEPPSQLVSQGISIPSDQRKVKS